MAYQHAYIPESWPRFITDSKSPFPLHPTINSVTSEIVSPFPQSHFQRSGSPSYTNSSSTCSSGLSPPTETDYSQIRSPPTPSDVAVFPPYEGWGTWPQVYEYTGLADACVNPGDVNPMQELPLEYYDDNVQRLNFPTRTCSVSSDGSISGHQGWIKDEGQDFRGLSPEIVNVKQEIQILDGMDSRDTPEAEEFELKNDPEEVYLKTEPTEDDDEDKDEEEDRDYSPFKEPKNILTESTHMGNSLKRRSTSQLSSDAKRAKTTMEPPLIVRSNTKSSIQGGKGQFSCPDCRKVTFKDRTGLENHIKKQHTRPFTCIFDFAGCRSTFASKNEWKRHCASQHIVLQYWVCQQDGCAQVSNKPNAHKKSSGSSRRRSSGSRLPCTHSSSLPNGTIFNRKDLYTQHLRRMHVPQHLKNKIKSKTPVPEWEEQQRVHQDKAIRTRCHLPTHMLCPAANCNVQFNGNNAWDDRMEHVAKHLEKVAAGLEPPMPFGGEDDRTLVDWATSPEIGILRRDEKGRWSLQSPLKSTGYPVVPVIMEQEEDDEDADAEGEEVDE
ncbi:hypothetical protein O1611_g397 [Lasiodiplodia mahajangana]|uniref:Uncharacterized protein n=1 Tax=Lasiodiplodia mahajangana TaxID=1108764 RepID=A0ACC2K0A4_9PEZI|nr:hypothetical protein O1611_g397 [Lasiodiplodia mahajangana]